jgi:hypothetical protein
VSVAADWASASAVAAGLSPLRYEITALDSSALMVSPAGEEPNDVPKETTS